MVMEKNPYLRREEVTVTLPRELVAQLKEYDPRTSELLGIDGFVATICHEWYGENVLRKTRARADELLFSEIKEPEDKSTEQIQPYILQVRNHHGESCGVPPHFDNPPNVYLSYFENQFREQSIFVYDYKTKEAFLYMGDASWDCPRKVIEGGRVPGLLYGEDEAAWL